MRRPLICRSVCLVRRRRDARGLAPQRSTFAPRKTGERVAAATTPWVRPRGLVVVDHTVHVGSAHGRVAAVFQSNSNFVTVRASSAFKVDWGDGAGWNRYAANTTAEKNLQWADYDAGTLCSPGLPAGVVTVEPQSGNLTGLELRYRHSNAAATTSTSSVWLDLRVACTGSPTIWVSGVSSGTRGCWRQWRSSLTSRTPAPPLFRLLFVADGPVFGHVVGTNFTLHVQNCSSLQFVPVLDRHRERTFQHVPEVRPALNTGVGRELRHVPALRCSSSRFWTRRARTSPTCSRTAIRSVRPGSGHVVGHELLQHVPELPCVADGPALNRVGYELYHVLRLRCSRSRRWLRRRARTSPACSPTAIRCSRSRRWTRRRKRTSTCMFYGCSSLQQVPALDTSSGTNSPPACSPTVRFVVGVRRPVRSVTRQRTCPPPPSTTSTPTCTAAGAQTITVTGNWGMGTTDDRDREGFSVVS